MLNHTGPHVGGTLSRQVQREKVGQWTKADQGLADDRQSSGGGRQWLFDHVNVLEAAELVFLEEGRRGMSRPPPYTWLSSFTATHSAVLCASSLQLSSSSHCPQPIHHSVSTLIHLP